MDTNHLNISESNNRNSILNHIINCANCALKDKASFKDAMKGLSHELRTSFKSEYCAIGTVVDGIAEDSAIDFEISTDEHRAKEQATELEYVRSADAKCGDTLVSIALESPQVIFSFDKNYFTNSKNFDHYKTILESGIIENSIVIPIRDDEGTNFGFIQFINTNYTIEFDSNILPYNDALLGLVQIIISNQKNQQILARKENRLKDADFYERMQENQDNVDYLLDSIMEYFSKQFNAAIISFRIPILNGHKKEPLFYLRRFFIHPSIKTDTRDLLEEHYTSECVKTISQMGGIDDLRCYNHGHILISQSNTDFSSLGLNLSDNTFIIPIFRFFDERCINPSRKAFNGFCKEEEHQDCTSRFKRLYGIFRLRIAKTTLPNNDNNDSYNPDETFKRLSYLSKQITLLLNSIVDKHENESLQTFQYELKNSSFIKIKDFDERCVRIIKNSTNAKVCSIYRYDNHSETLALSATTAQKIEFDNLPEDANDIIKDCTIPITETKNVLAKVHKKLLTKYVFNIKDPIWHQSRFIEMTENNDDKELSAMVVPMIKKSGSCSGVVLLIGKERHRHSISTAYWEHDIELIEFIVKILTRISESDTERLTFLTQLSHELLAPVAELVYDNDYTVSIAERNIENFTKRQLISKLQENIDRYMLFKYIISDTEFIYSTSQRNIDYNFELYEKPQLVLLDAIRLLEKEAHAKTLSIKTYISQMPPLYFDKERMMQVFLNLLRNAIRYSRANTEISISYNLGSNNFHEICFANFGIGVHKKEKESIFNLFFRGKEAKLKIERGTGMGLYIVRDIMNTHGGDCYVKRLNHPTEFVITLPNTKLLNKSL